MVLSVLNVVLPLTVDATSAVLKWLSPWLSVIRYQPCGTFITCAPGAESAGIVAEADSVSLLRDEESSLKELANVRASEAENVATNAIGLFSYSAGRSLPTFAMACFSAVTSSVLSTVSMSIEVMVPPSSENCTLEKSATLYALYVWPCWPFIMVIVCVAPLSSA